MFPIVHLLHGLYLTVPENLHGYFNVLIRLSQKLKRF